MGLNPGDFSMHWPTGKEAGNSKVFARNERVIPAPPERIWRWLCRAERWPEWHSNCTDIRLRDDAGPDLVAGTRFVWKTFGVRVRSQVVTYIRAMELGWSATAFGLRGYHGWLFEALDPGRTRVITEETQVGPLTRVGRWHLRRELAAGHRRWLEELSRVAQTGDP
jgi:uncharacterized protein YndB with AHSA1/START domain